MSTNAYDPQIDRTTYKGHLLPLHYNNLCTNSLPMFVMNGKYIFSIIVIIFTHYHHTPMGLKNYFQKIRSSMISFSSFFEKICFTALRAALRLAALSIRSPLQKNTDQHSIPTARSLYHHPPHSPTFFPISGRAVPN